MAILILILFLIFCIMLGFSGMPYMFIFPALFLILVIIGIVDSKNNKVNGNNDYIKKNQDDNSNLDDETLEEHIMFTEMTDHHK